MKNGEANIDPSKANKYVTNVQFKPSQPKEKCNNM